MTPKVGPRFQPGFQNQDSKTKTPKLEHDSKTGAQEDSKTRIPKLGPGFQNQDSKTMTPKLEHDSKTRAQDFKTGPTFS